MGQHFLPYLYNISNELIYSTFHYLKILTEYKTLTGNTCRKPPQKYHDNKGYDKHIYMNNKLKQISKCTNESLLPLVCDNTF